jgi:hypothetical protein
MVYNIFKKHDTKLFKIPKQMLLSFNCYFSKYHKFLIDIILNYICQSLNYT